MENIKICVVSQQLGHIISGPGLYTFNLVNDLINNGYEVHVIAPENQRIPDKGSLYFHGVRKPFANTSQARWFTLSYLFWKEYKKLSNHIVFNLVHFTDAREALFFNKTSWSIGNVNDTYAANLQPISYYKRYFNDWSKRWLYYFFMNKIERYIYSKVSLLITNSDFTTQMIVSKYGIPEVKIRRCYKSIDTKFWKSINPTKERNRNGIKKILFVGTNMQRKGLPTLISAAPTILTKYPGTKFIVVGEDPAISTMKVLSMNLGVLNNFIFLGWQSQDDLLDIYADADIFVMPSLTEAFGVTLLEALAAGVPVITTKTGGIPEIIHDGENGLLIAPDNPEELIQAVDKIFYNRSLANTFIINGRETVDNFDLAHMMDCTYKIYEKYIHK